MKFTKEDFILFTKKIEGIIKRKKDIRYIKVRTSRQTFYVKDKKKISYWIYLSKKIASSSFEKDISPSVKIVKVVYH